MGISEGDIVALTRREMDYMAMFDSKPPFYLQGYLDNYDNNKGLVRCVLDRLGIPEPTHIRVAREVYAHKRGPLVKGVGGLG